MLTVDSHRDGPTGVEKGKVLGMTRLVRLRSEETNLVRTVYAN